MMKDWIVLMCGWVNAWYRVGWGEVRWRGMVCNVYLMAEEGKFAHLITYEIYRFFFTTERNVNTQIWTLSNGHYWLKLILKHHWINWQFEKLATQYKNKIHNKSYVI